jgi:adenylate cyclase
MEAEAPLRRPMALLFCDIAGSTRLVAQEGDLVAATVFREFREQAGGLAREHHCSMIKFLGDAFLAAFENIDDVMPVMVSLQNLLSQNATFIGRLEGFKFSVHYGDVLYIETSYGDDVLGKDVALAARLSELAQPNEVVISQAALQRMPAAYLSRAGASEVRAFKQCGDVEFRRLDLS